MIMLLQTNIDNILWLCHRFMTVRKDTASGKVGDDPISMSLPSCMKTPFVTKDALAGTNKGKAAIIEGKNLNLFSYGQFIKTKILK